VGKSNSKDDAPLRSMLSISSSTMGMFDLETCGPSDD